MGKLKTIGKVLLTGAKVAGAVVGGPVGTAITRGTQAIDLDGDDKESLREMAVTAVLAGAPALIAAGVPLPQATDTVVAWLQAEAVKIAQEAE